jgi:methionyl-tRNA formyltransferase
MSLKVLLLCGAGRYQQELARRAASRFSLAGIVWHRPENPTGSLVGRLLRYRDPRALARYLQVRAFLPAHERAAEPLRQVLFPDPLGTTTDTPEISVPDINAPEAVAFVEAQRPDIVLVNGSNLLRKPMLGLIPKIPLGIINLHTGLSPYSRGGNCNLFMLLEGRPERVGITVHHINPGIDSGDIILSAQVPMTVADNYEMVDIRTFDTGIEALLQCARELSEGTAARVPQWESGKLFLRRTGYVYEPYHRLVANRLLARGLVRDYLADKVHRDVGIRTVGKLS